MRLSSASKPISSRWNRFLSDDGRDFHLAPLGAPSGGLAFGGGALQTTATFTTARPVTLNAGGGTFIPNVGTTLTLAGAVGGVGGLTMAGGGTLVLAGASSYSSWRASSASS